MKPDLQPFQADTVELAGQRLIEASAGTGKTFTIAALYLRLVVERGYPVARILVVTFTNAATAELADRIRRRLAEARRALDGIEDFERIEDDFLRALAERSELDPDTLRRRLDNALRGFDEAAIFTIHGFCQRVLADRAFESGMAFEVDLEADVSERLAEIVDDFWRRTFYAAPPLLVDWLLEEKYTPEALLQDIRAHLGKPYLDVRQAAPPEALREIEDAFTSAWLAAREVWTEQSDEALDALRAAMEQGALNKNQYKAEQLSDWENQLDQYLAAERPVPALPCKFAQFTTGKLDKATKKGFSTPQHPLFDRCQALAEAQDALHAAFENQLHNLRAELLDYANQQLVVRKRRDQVQSYDDLLLNLDRALDQPTLGPQLANAIRKRYPAALIDEFQDTDPLQYAIFRRIYGGSDCPLFLVGDPKQAIYSFRGADIFAYLDAHAEAQQRLTLTRNWRSTPELIGAVNTLFERHDAPFLLPEISFYPVAPAEMTEQERAERRLAVEGDDPTPLRIWFLHDPENKRGFITKGQAREQVATACADEIARLLNLAAADRARLGERPLQGGDIAVLVRTHDEGAAVRAQLLRLGIPSVQRSRENVFDSPEAEQLERLLLAVLEPSREGRVRAALATELIGFDAAALIACETDERLREQQLERLQQLQDQWRRRGFAVMFRQALHDWNIDTRLLGYEDGERRLTNLLHLGELLQIAALGERLAPEPLLGWLVERRRVHSGEAEEQQLRLESDEQLVQIVTLHKSKGLQYPIVFCPFGWSSGRDLGKDAAVQFHDPETDNRAVLDLGSDQQPRACRLAERERLAENLRLLYVGLTRAEQRCYLGWGAINTAEHAAPAWLFHRPRVGQPGEEAFESASAYYKALEAATVWRELEAIAARSEGCIALSALPAGPGPRYRPVAPATTEFRARAFAGPVAGRWQIGSFTALTRHEGEAGRPLLPVERPDYDELPAEGRGDTVESAPDGGVARSIFDFPRGARAGSCLHEVFELLDFTRAEDCEGLVEKTLLRHGFDTAWTPTVCAMVERVLATPLDAAGLTLSRVSRDQRLDELEFHYPVAGAAGERLSSLLTRLGDWPGPLRERIESLDIDPQAGYMKGYIDLVFEHQGRYYLVDYKSNWLGRRPEEYGPERLAEAMAEASYHLQYLIYAVALHRYLYLRLPGYDYACHFGGVFYLFLRGMDPSLPGCGVYVDRPSTALIEALDGYFAGLTR